PVHPLTQLLQSLLEWKAGVVRDVVCPSHEGVDGAQSIALMCGENQESVVEVFCGGACDMTANTVRCPQLQRGIAHRNFLVAARASSQSLRGFEITGRRVSTS